MTLVIPSKSINTELHVQLSRIHSLISTLKTRNLLLAETRDLLLPYLISGKIDISDLGIDVGEVAI